MVETLRCLVCRHDLPEDAEDPTVVTCPHCGVCQRERIPKARAANSAVSRI